MLKMLLAAGAALMASAAVAPVPAQAIPPGDHLAEAGLVVLVEHDIEIIEPFAYAEPPRVYRRRSLPPGVIIEREIPVRIETALTANEVRRLLKRRGFRSVASVRRNGGTYRARATDPHGNRVWVTLSADGEILRARLVRREPARTERRIARAEPEPKQRVVRQKPKPEARVVREEMAPEKPVARTLKERVEGKAAVAAAAPRTPERLPEPKPEEPLTEVAALDPAAEPAPEPSATADEARIEEPVAEEALAAEEAPATPDGDDVVEEASTVPDDEATEEPVLEEVPDAPGGQDVAEAPAAEAPPADEPPPEAEAVATAEDAPAGDDSLSDKSLPEAELALAPAAAEPARKPIRDVTRQPKPLVEEPAEVAALGESATQGAGEVPAEATEPAADEADVPLAAQQAAVLAPAPLPRPRPAGGVVYSATDPLVTDGE